MKLRDAAGRYEDSIPRASLEGAGFRFAVLVSRFNIEITGALLESCLRTLQDHGVPRDDIKVVPVPGAFELPLVAQKIARKGKHHAVIALGCIIRGDTPHDRYIAQEVSRGLGQAALAADVPVIFGVLTPLNIKQARARAGKGPLNKGREAALAALEMAQLFKTMRY
ncbi:MAG: 6,7-dimethyl-8-ribityllumazine synthase [Elusimicrobia bacterium]|nr:6,7-dimethyl-8-ribityllumazine synthase [Elusimicrobiota bacterium]